MTVSASQRFTRDYRCPVCQGYEGAARGNGQRCWGFLSDNGEWAHCVREELAGGLALKPNSDTYTHRLVGSCKCGERHDPRPAPAQPARRVAPRVATSASSDGQGRKPVKAYDYRDEEGRLLSQAVRFKPKSFSQRRPDGKCGWVWNLEGVRRILFRLSELIEADPIALVWVCEGERDADRLAKLGLVATTNAMGAGKWRDEYSEFLRARSVIVLEDNDKAGREHVQQVAQSVYGIASSVKVLALPDLPDNGGDLSDWLAAGGTVAELQALAEQTPVWEPPAVEQAAPLPVSGNGTQPNDEQPVFPRTDAGNAELFAFLFNDRLRFDHQRGRWLLWDGKRWRPDPDAEVYRLAIQATRVRCQNAGNIDDLKEREKETIWAIKGEQRTRIEATLALGKAQLGIADAGLGWDADPWLLNVGNGTIDLRTGELREHRQDDRITMLVPTDCDPEAKCPTWDAFLDRILGGRRELVEYLQQLVGYSMTGDVSEQIIILLIGLGSNGKSTLEEALLELFADYATMAAPGLLLTSRNERHPTELADLHGKRFVMSIEVGEGKRLAETLVKQLSGSDTIKARRMNEDFWSFKPTHQLWLAANYKPVIKGTDLAIWRRIRLVPFDVVIPPAERNKKLPAELRAELPGILAWAVRGCLAWQKDGLELPEAVTVATAAYQEESDVLADFLRECCVVGDGYSTQASTLYKAYTAWADDEGLRPRDVLSSTMFGRRMTDHFHKEHKRQGWVYFGIGLPATNVTRSVTSSESDHPVLPLKGPVTPRIETNLQNQSNPSPSLENPAPYEDERCKDCGVEVNYYDPEGTAYCARHGPGPPWENRK